MKTIPIGKLGILALSVFATIAPARSADLIINGNFDAGFTGFSSSYNFVASGQGTPGDFGIRTFSQDFNSGFDAFMDHTTGTGNMMLVDGSPTPNVTVWQESVSVSPATDYTFSAFATAADGVDTPTLRFLINSVQIGSDLLLVTPGNWQNFTNVWNSGASTTATITIVDTKTATLGNDFALDDISFSPTVPEPSTFAFLATAFGFVAFFRRRIRK
jgi:hypothetical protein